MKIKLLFLFLLLNSTYAFSQQTPKWEKLNNGLIYLKDSTSDKDNYIFNKNTIWNFTYFFNKSYAIEKLDSNTYARVVRETIQSYPKTGKYLSQMNDIKNYDHIEISNNRMKTWNRIFSFKDNSDEYFDNIRTDSLGGLNLYYLNDSTILLSGTFKEYGYYDSPYIGKLNKGANPDSLWNFELIRYWRRSTFMPLDVKMINEKIGYGQYRNIYKNREEIFRTDDCWKTYKLIYPYDTEINPPKNFDNLTVSWDEKDTLVLFLENYNEFMLYYSLDNFKTNFIIDFTDLETVYRVYALSPKIIFALTWGEKKENNTEYPFYKLMKTTNYGNSWSTLFETSKGDSVYNFRVFDEENIALTGKFHPAPHIRSSFLQTKNGGKNWIYLFEPNYSDYYNNSIAYNFIPTFLYATKENIICCKNTTYYKQPNYDKDLSYFNQILDFRDRTYNERYEYYQSKIENTLIPPYIKIDASLLKKHNFGTDTLYWDKVESATRYQITYYGVASAAYKLSNYSTQNNFTTVTTKKIDTLVKDTFLVLKNLKRNYKYKFFASAVNEFQRSEETFLETTCFEEPNLEKPVIITPKPFQAYPVFYDTLDNNKIEFNWNTIPGADFYNIALYDSDSLRLLSTPYSNRILFNHRDLTETSLVWSNLQPNTWYSFVITAQNEDEISDYGYTKFYVKDVVSVPDKEILECETISPNPASNYIIVDVSFLRMQESEIKIFNIFGECVLTVETIHELSLQKIDVSTLPEGVYFVRVGEKTLKFIKI